MKTVHSKIYNKIKCNHMAMSKVYDNVDDYYDLIHMPTRVANFVEKCWSKVDLCFRDNPDTGGFLCVIGYNDKNLNILEYTRLVRKYIDSVKKSKNTHCLRWCISLSYLCGTLTDNINWYKECISYDFTKFSPLILTKVLSACLKLHALTRDKKYLAEGIELYKKGLKCNFNNVFGDDGFYTRVGITDFCKATEIFREIGCKIGI